VDALFDAPGGPASVPTVTHDLSVALYPDAGNAATDIIVPHEPAELSQARSPATR
jgi:hypothetical protein